MSAAIDDGILALVRARRLSAVGCLAQAPSFRADAARLRELDVDAGLHLNFTETLGAAGLYLPLPRLIVCAYARLLNRGRVQRQIERQLDAFESAMGRMPDFVDGHQHVHQLPQIRDALFEVLARRYAGQGPWLRDTAPGCLDGVPTPLRRKARIIAALGARPFARAAAQAGLRTNRRFLGVYDFQGGAQAYDSLFRLWVRNAAEGDLLMCHPALPSGGRQGMDAQRGAEYQVLSNPALDEWMASIGVRVARYASMTLRANPSR
uniref:ChbG/HpnK family deacetylase n=1 Tax=Bordetella sputigena TaxID=1416810 RepID=UPI0039EFCD6D